MPTPITKNNQPDLTFLIRASENIGYYLKHGAIVVYESTVYPGVIEEVCGPVLARVSGLQQSVDFKLAYSPERISSGQGGKKLTEIVKVVSGEDDSTLERVANLYESIDAGVYRAPSIKVAEAAKVVENTQRDLILLL